jgi:hypothetical protein
MTEIAVWVAGVVGLSIVLRAGALYSGTDRLALMLVLLIGAGLALGIYELAMRARRALRFAREIDALPRTPSEQDLDALSPEVASVLRARIAGVPSASASQPYAAYLLGLLVMIGLLGTFMGLFESLRGAREALGSSGDVAALRAALGAPMTGLARAFGTSAAGVSASAVLGLALVVVRRGEARNAAALANYSAGPLASLTVARRTLDALEAIAKQGAMLPTASEAITRGANAMSDVARDVGAALQQTTVTIGDDLRAVASAVRDDLRGASEASARAVASAVKPSLESAVTRVLESSAAQSEARIARENKHAELVAARVEKAVESIVEAHRVHATELRESIARDAKSVIDTVIAGRDLLAEAEAERAQSISASMKETSVELAKSIELLIGRIEASAHAIEAARELQIAAEAERARSVAAALQQTVTVISEQLQTTTRDLTEANATRFDAIASRVEESANNIAAASTLSAEQLAQYVEKLAAIRDELRADDDARAERVAAATETRLEELAATVSEALATSMERVVASAQAAPEAAARVIANAAERLKKEGEANIERDARLELLVERLDALATAIDARGGEQTDRVAELSTKLHDTYEKTAAALEKGGVELTSTAELFGASVDKYREASEKWMTGLAVMRAAAERAAQGDAQDMLAAYLEQTREVFDHTLQFQRQLFNELRQPRDFAPPRLLSTGTDPAEAEE